MYLRNILRAWTYVLVLFVGVKSSVAQITVEGVEDREFYRDRISFRVETEEGFDYTVELNEVSVATDTLIEVKDPDYYELFVLAVDQTSADENTELVRFIVRAGERGNSESGLPVWVPYPLTPSAPAETDGARLEIVLPGVFVSEMEIPVIATVTDEEGRRVGVNGRVTAADFPDHRLSLLRGIGCAFLPAIADAGMLQYTARFHSLETSRQVQVEASPTWTEISGRLNSDADWGEEARIHLTDDLTIAAGVTLTVGAGGLIKIAPEVEIEVEGKIVVNGTRERPVVWAPESRDSPWGGFLLRTEASQAEIQGSILTGSGADPDWFDNNPGSGGSHRHEQCLFYLSDGAHATLTDCFLIHNQGQAGHCEDSHLTMTRCLVQRCVTAGQYNGGSLTLRECALLEFPEANLPFADADNDALYLTSGTHSLTDCLVGWTLDDGIDAGGSSGDTVDIKGCWFESCYHEGIAWSGGKDALVQDSVFLNCGQGIECGYDGPDVLVERCLTTANLVGARFGDNYDWDYDGNFLRVRDSLLLYNKRDVWSRAWDDWSLHLSQMEIIGNYLSAPNPHHPDNRIWQPDTDASRLEPFLNTPDSTVGVGIAISESEVDISRITKGIPVRLSTLTTRTVSVNYTISSEEGLLEAGNLQFGAGETLKRIEVDHLELNEVNFVEARLESGVNAGLTGVNSVRFVRTFVELIPAGSVWKYSDEGLDLGESWRTLEYDDSTWSSGAAELGFGDDDEVTVIRGGPSDSRTPTIYFRRRIDVVHPAEFGHLLLNLRRDDGAIVYLNDTEVFRSNMPEGPVSFSTLADTSQTSETAFFTREISAERLVAGPNIVAVEVHQASATSSDMSFELELLGQLDLSSPTLFIRGDDNDDSAVDLSDSIVALRYLFIGGTLDCLDAADANDDGKVDITDPIHILSFLFRGEAPVAEPLATCGKDPTDDDLTCESYPSCP